MQPLIIAQALVLLALANGTPVIAKRVLGPRLAWPLDGGLRFLDGRPLFGASKTVRGMVLSVAVTAAVSPAVGVEAETGALFAAASMGGDLFSSFVKRRLNRPASSRALGLDQVPESLVPLLVCAKALALGPADMAAVVAIFFVGELVTSRLLYKLRIRDQPY
jgi:CDP-diglyceride synthetase